MHVFSVDEIDFDVSTGKIILLIGGGAHHDAGGAPSSFVRPWRGKKDAPSFAGFHERLLAAWGVLIPAVVAPYKRQDRPTAP